MESMAERLDLQEQAVYRKERGKETASVESAKCPVTISAENGHAHCLLCGESNPWSLRLFFRPDEDDVASAQFQADSRLQGYEGILHGGMIAALLDSAMTHCLFHQGVRALTGDLRVRFRKPVSCDAALTIRAWVVTSRPPLYRLRAELLHEGNLMAWGEARFLHQRARSRQ